MLNISPSAELPSLLVFVKRLAGKNGSEAKRPPGAYLVIFSIYYIPE